MAEAGPLSGDLGAGPFQRPPVGNQPRAHRLTCPAAETEIDDTLERAVDLEDPVVDRLHRLDAAAG
jgi:hypothetical protein